MASYASEAPLRNGARNACALYRLRMAISLFFMNTWIWRDSAIYSPDGLPDYPPHNWVPYKVLVKELELDLRLPRDKACFTTIHGALSFKAPKWTLGHPMRREYYNYLKCQTAVQLDKQILTPPPDKDPHCFYKDTVQFESSS
ncbi:hypothetical protein G9A89_000348 [Geosiphon pyriformis]|nr:hypothetical protein G9A89_000348 [Geosiphon pyriformis]